MESSFAPVVLFVYNRANHVAKTIETLKKNELASSSDLIVYSDGPKDSGAQGAVDDVRRYLRSVDGFKSVLIVEREINWGLAASIVDGVGAVVSRYGKVIVLEDDIVTSPSFLNFMNLALDFYESKDRVWHISGWNYPIATDGLSDVFLWRVMNCWGWATWADRWEHFSKEPERLMSEWTPKQKYEFDLDGSGVFWSQVEANATGKLNTWAIFWYATIFQNGGLCLNPAVSYVDNIGHDGSGTNCGNTHLKQGRLNDKKTCELNVELVESVLARKRIKSFVEPTLMSKFKGILSRYVHR